MRKLRQDRRGFAAAVTATPALIALAIMALIVFLVVVVFLGPAYFLSVLLIIAGIAILVLFKTNPYGLFFGFATIVLGGILAVIANGQTLSLALVHAL